MLHWRDELFPVEDVLSSLSRVNQFLSDKLTKKRLVDATLANKILSRRVYHYNGSRLHFLERAFFFATERSSFDEKIDSSDPSTSRLASQSRGVTILAVTDCVQKPTLKPNATELHIHTAYLG